MGCYWVGIPSDSYHVRHPNVLAHLTQLVTLYESNYLIVLCVYWCNSRGVSMKNIQGIVDKHYDQIFDEIIKETEGMYELIIEVKDKYTGLTVRRSWKDRDKMLSEENE